MLGNFERIYPDEEPIRAQCYDRVLNTAQTLFGRTATNRRTVAQQNATSAKVDASKPASRALKKLQAAAAAAVSAGVGSGSVAAPGSSADVSSVSSSNDSTVPTGGGRESPSEAAIANADDKAAAAIAAAACFLGLPASNATIGAAGSGSTDCAACSAGPGCAVCAQAAPFSMASLPACGGDASSIPMDTARNPFSRLMHPSCFTLCNVRSHEDSYGACATSTVAAPAGASLGHIGAVGWAPSSEPCTCGYGLHWRCPSIHEVSAISRRQCQEESGHAAGHPVTAAGGGVGTGDMLVGCSPFLGSGLSCGGSSAFYAMSCSAAGAARLELLTRVDQLEARRRGGSSPLAPAAKGMGGHAQGTRLSAAAGNSAACADVGDALSMASVVSGGGSGIITKGSGPSEKAGVEGSAGTSNGYSGGISSVIGSGEGCAGAGASSPSSRCGSHGAISWFAGRSTLAGPAHLSATVRERGYSAGTDASRASVAPAWTGGRGRSHPAAGSSSCTHAMHGGEPQHPTCAEGDVATAEGDADGRYVSRCVGSSSGAQASLGASCDRGGSGGGGAGGHGGQSRSGMPHTTSQLQPNPDPWWVSRRQGSIGAAPERRRCTPPACGFSLGSSEQVSHAPAARDSVVGARTPAATIAKQDAVAVHALQGSRLHTLPLRVRAPTRSL